MEKKENKYNVEHVSSPVHGHSHCHGHDSDAGGMIWWRMGLSFAMLVTGIFVGDGMAFFEPYRWLWYMAAYFLVSFSVLKSAVKSVAHGDVFSEFMLMSIASVGAFCIGDYPEAVAVMLLYRIGEVLQDKAVDRARNNIRGLLAFRPDKAVIVKDGKKFETTPEEVRNGDFIEVKPGERVPLDGILMTSEASFNTSALTGESVPRMMEAGGEVLAGMIVTDSVVQLKVIRPAGESAIARILKMVSDASERKAPTELFIRRFARVYTPIVIGLAVLTVFFPWLWSLAEPSFDYVFRDWLHRALVFLVISCPCALVISIPLGYFGGIGAASRRGILFKGGNSLDAVAELDTVVFDKTGTLTTGEFVVQRTKGIGDEDLYKVKVMEQNSNHPVAKAVVKYADSVLKGQLHVVFKGLKDIPGYGLSAIVDGDRWLVGTLRLLRREGISFPENLGEIPETMVLCAKNGVFIGYILLSDTIKDDARRAVENLKNGGMKRVLILSGDKQSIVDEVSDTLCVDGGYGDLLPQDKVSHIERLKRNGGRIAFVGDGINDAPVLALSDVGIAMGAMGADMAVETADIVIQTDQPSKVAEAVSVGKRTRSIVKQNIVLAIGVKVAVMILGFFGMANLWMAVFADTGVALIAVLNATRVFLERRHS